MRVVNVALIGYGLAGATFHAPVIAAVGRLRLTAVVTSRIADVARTLPGMRTVATADEVFADPAIELVVIATPNDTHADLARRALLAGKHVVIDKPLTATSADADALIALAAERGNVLSVYHNRRWDGDFLTVQDIVASGRLGHVALFEVNFDRFRPAIKPGWREIAGSGSGVLFDLGSHLIDQALTLFGMPETIAADILMQRPLARVDDYFALVLGYPNRRAYLRASTLVRAPGPHYAVHGDAGSFVKYGMDPQEAALKAGIAVDTPHWGEDDPERYGTFVPADGPRETIATHPGAYRDFYAGIGAAITEGASPPVTGAQARDVIRLIELARRSSAEQRTIAIDP